MIIDSHSHLFDKPYDSDREEVIARMKEFKVSTITVGTSWHESLAAVRLAEKYSELGEVEYKMWATVGQHPTDAFEDFNYDEYKKLAENKCVVGIGECGLDYVQSKFSKLPLDQEKERQKGLFKQQIQLALEIGKPLMLHLRPTMGTMDAYVEALVILESYIQKHSSTPMGTVHFFTGTLELAEQYLRAGFALSFNGVLTFTHQYDDVVKNVPPDMFLIETDAPYVAPVPYRGKRNDPVYVFEVARRVAEIRGITPEEAGELAGANARRIFAL